MPDEHSWPFRSEHQGTDATPSDSARGQKVRWHSRSRGQPRRVGLGRRRTDYDPRSTVTAKVIAGIVFVINAFYLVGDALISHGHCP